MTRPAEKKESLQDDDDACEPALPPLKPRQEQFIDALLSGKNITAAARATAVPMRTALRWMQNHHPVILTYEQRRLELRHAFKRRMEHLHDLTFKALEGSLTSKNPAIRYSAAKLIWQAHLQQWYGVTFSEQAQTLLDEESDVRLERLGLTPYQFTKSMRDYIRECALSDDPMDLIRALHDDEDDDEDEPTDAASNGVNRHEKARA